METYKAIVSQNKNNSNVVYGFKINLINNEGNGYCYIIAQYLLKN